MSTMTATERACRHTARFYTEIGNTLRDAVNASFREYDVTKADAMLRRAVREYDRAIQDALQHPATYAEPAP